MIFLYSLSKIPTKGVKMALINYDDTSVSNSLGLVEDAVRVI